MLFRSRILGSTDDVRRSDKVAALRFPEPKPCGRVPLTASGLSRSYGSLEVFTDVRPRRKEIGEHSDRRSSPLNTLCSARRNIGVRQLEVGDFHDGRDTLLSKNLGQLAQIAC